MYDDLLTCKTCGHQKYPEVFQCPRASGRGIRMAIEQALSGPEGRRWLWAMRLCGAAILTAALWMGW